MLKQGLIDNVLLATAFQSQLYVTIRMGDAMDVGPGG